MTETDLTIQNVQEHVSSYYRPRAKEIVERQFPEKTDLLLTVLDAIDREGETSLIAFESKLFPGTKTPFNRVDISVICSVISKNALAYTYTESQSNLT